MVLDKNRVADYYRRYGFEIHNTNNENIIVCTINNGHYYNADIVVLDHSIDSKSIFDEYTKSGYACQSREYSSLIEVEDALFKGFFTVDSSRKRLKKLYNNFTHSLVSNFSENAEYSYINSNYYINGEEGQRDVLFEIKIKLEEKKPVLFLIEAAAGFGKTCTAYELLRDIIDNSDDILPLFTELSRNRQAKIFRYVLLDEIDNFFPTLSSKLVRLEIKEGKVPVILDGFDELLHTKIDEKNEDINETMIETIGALLEGSAKVILTTRRTALFDGDDFHEWMSSHKDDFEIVRIKIDEPTVSHWLESDRLDLLNRNGFSIDRLSNPVLLSFLRSISSEEFIGIASEPDKIVKKYFDLMLDRERIRQDLNMKVSEQYGVFVKLSKDMIDLSYTSESREYLTAFFLEYENDLLEEVRNRYPNDNRPTKDELVNKLASHALLDKAQSESKGIGFINEFVLGSFCAENIIESDEDFAIEDIRFIAPAVTSYVPRSEKQKKELWDALSFVMEFVDSSERLKYMVGLNNKIVKNIVDSTIENITIKNIEMGEKYLIKNTLFAGCSFINVIINCQNIQEVSFVGCSFYSSKIVNYNSESNISLLGCKSDNKLDEELVINENILDDKKDFEKECELFILEKFWPKGRDTFYKHRHIKGIYSCKSDFTHKDILKALDRLRKKEFIQEPIKVSFAELNTNKISDIKKYMGKS